MEQTTASAIEAQIREWREEGLIKVKRLEDGRLLMQFTQKAITTSEDARNPPSVQAVFDVWNEAYKAGKAKLTPSRRRLIHTRLRQWSQDDLQRAVLGYRKSPHHMGGNATGMVYDSLELFLRDDSHVQRGLDLHSAPAAKPATAARRDPQEEVQVDMSREAWIRDMRQRLGQPDWQPPEDAKPIRSFADMAAALRPGGGR